MVGVFDFLSLSEESEILDGLLLELDQLHVAEAAELCVVDGVVESPKPQNPAKMKKKSNYLDTTINYYEIKRKYSDN